MNQKRRSHDDRRCRIAAAFFAALLSAVYSAPMCADEPLADGLVLWLDAGDLDADGEQEMGVGFGSHVKDWRDKSGAENHLRQQNADRQPLLTEDGIGNRPSMQFANSVFERDEFNGFRAGEQRFQIFAVMKSELRDGNSPRILDLPTRSRNPQNSGAITLKRKGFWLGYQDFEDTVGKLRLGVHVGDEAQSYQVAWDGSPHLVEAAYAGNQRWSLYQDGAPAGRGRFRGDNTFVGFDGGARLSLGQQYGSTEETTFFQGHLAEILVYDRVLTTDEQRRVGVYLATKYGLETAYQPEAAAVPRFETDILPILRDSCLDCHGKDEPSGSLDLRSMTGILRGGVSGPSVQRGQSIDSLLLHMVATNEMPPPDQQRPLSDEKVELVRHWIDSGAPADEQVDLAALTQSSKVDHWAFQKLQVPAVPAVKHAHQVRSPIDAFVLAGLEAKELSFSPSAEPTTLIRRIYLDLLGLLPTPAEVQTFVEESRRDDEVALAALVDRVLDSPHFGERWGRHWLDGAGYTDTLPLDNDQTIIKPGSGKWKYRDYVVRSLNADKPFTQFLLEQLAGDELVDWRNAPRLTEEMRDNLIATGFLRCGTDFTDENELNTLVVRYGILHRTSESLANNLLGLTMQCCQCHDHKFEPLTQRDYYRFTAIMMPALDPKNWRQPAVRQLSGLGSEEQADLQQQIRQWEEKRSKINTSAEQRLLDEKTATLPEQFRNDVRAAFLIAESERNEVQRYLAEKFSSLKEGWDQQVVASYSDEEKQIVANCNANVGRINDQIKQATIQAVYDISPQAEAYVLRRGNYETPGAPVQPDVFRVLSTGHQFGTSIKATGSTSGRRLALAQQLTDWDSPCGGLVARVRVNRVWQQLFGQGLVESSDNFGVSGAAPTHPELLEWLACFFVEQETRLKPLLELIVTSKAYRQSSRIEAARHAVAGINVDPGNRLLWRQRLRRLESEAVRDNVLVASGRLDRTMGGAPVATQNRPDGKVIEVTSSWRRSMYLLQRRNYHLSMLAAFDQPLLTGICVKRETSSVVAQSLTMLNDRFVIQQAGFLAERVEQESPDAVPEAQIRTAFGLVLARSPDQTEQAACKEAYEKHLASFLANGQNEQQARRNALTQICHMLFNTSEFLYVQ